MAFGRFAQFLGAYSTTKLVDGIDGLAAFVARLDPEGMSRADIALLESNKKKYAGKLFDAQQAFDKEESEAAEAEAEVARYEAALGALQVQHNAAPEKKRAAILASATTLGVTLTKKREDAARERREADRAKQVLDAVQRLFSTMDQHIASATARLQAARQDLAEADADREHAELMAAFSQESEGLTGVSVALDAMTSAAADARRQTFVAKQMTRATTVDPADAIVAAALGETASDLPVASPFDLLQKPAKAA